MKQFIINLSLTFSFFILQNLCTVMWEDGKSRTRARTPKTRINENRLRQKGHTLESFVKEFSEQT